MCLVTMLCWLSCVHIEVKIPFNISNTDSSPKFENLHLALSKHHSSYPSFIIYGIRCRVRHVPANEHSRKENVLKSIHYSTSFCFLLFNILFLEYV